MQKKRLMKHNGQESLEDIRYYYKLVMGIVQGIQDYTEKELLHVNAIKGNIQNPVVTRRLHLSNPYFGGNQKMEKTESRNNPNIFGL